MARTKEYDRDIVLDAATQIFWVKGFKGTSISDLVSATGLGKRSMYQEFGSKEGLFRECIDTYVLKMISETNNTLKRQPLGIRNIEAFFQQGIDYASSSECSGCLLVNSAIEKELLEKEAFIKVTKSLARIEELLYQCLKTAQENGEIARDKECRVLAAFLFTFANGIMVRSKTAPSKDSLIAQVEIALSSIQG